MEGEQTSLRVRLFFQCSCNKICVTLRAGIVRALRWPVSSRQYHGFVQDTLACNQDLLLRVHTLTRIRIVYIECCYLGLRSVMPVSRNALAWWRAYPDNDSACQQCLGLPILKVSGPGKVSAYPA